jgi:hypothetical protein
MLLDVAIAGGGPGGLATANALLQAIPNINLKVITLSVPCDGSALNSFREPDRDHQYTDFALYIARFSKAPAK